MIIINFLAPLSILGWAFFLYLILKRIIERQNGEFSIWVVVSSLIVILYFAALAGHLRPTAISLFWSGLLAWGLSIYFIWQRKIKQWTNFFSPGVVIFLSLTLLFVLSFSKITLQFWDEFSHWAVATKELLANHNLPNATGSTIFKEYPLGVNLAHYWTAVNIADTEAIYYLGHFLLLIAPFVIFFSELSWHKFKKIIILFIGLLLIIFTLSVYACSLMADLVLALYLGAGLFFATHRNLTRYEFLLFTPILMALPLIKSSGYMFAWMILITLIIAQSQQLLKNWKNQRQSVKITIILVFLAVLLAPSASYLSWEYRNKTLGIIPTFKTKAITLQNTIEAFSHRASTHQILIRKNFAKALWNTPLVNYTLEPERSLVQSLKKILSLPNWIQPPQIGLIGWLILAALLYIPGLIYQSISIQRQRIFLILLLFIFFGTIYIFGLLLLYLFSFSEFDGLHLASFARYINTILIPLMLIALSFTITNLNKDLFLLHRNIGKHLACFICLSSALLGILLQAPSWEGIPKWQIWGEASKERSSITPLTEEIKQLTQPTSRIFIIYQHSAGRGFHIIRYEIVPRITNNWFFSLGYSYYDGDVWTELLPPKAWKQMLIDEKFDFLFLARTDEQFWNTYNEIFLQIPNPRIHTIFKICKDENELIRLEPISKEKNPNKN